MPTRETIEKWSKINPEPWVKSLLWIALALLALSLIFRDVFSVKYMGFEASAGMAGVKDGQDTKTKPGEPGVPRGGVDTTYVSVCPPKTRAIGGSCTVKTGSVALQNFGPERNAKGEWQFACVWVSKVEGDALAVCVPEK
jgi:hypothetical protein